MQPGRVFLKYNQTWPDSLGIQNAVTLTYTAGYGATANLVPEGLKTAIKMLVSHWYEHRETAAEKQLMTIPLAVESLLWQHRIPEIG
jgi:uncharacterized phiE125 gp8 family phage protein